MTWIPPEDVRSPRHRWNLLGVLYNGGEGEWAAAYGDWDGTPVIVVRWNGHNVPRRGLGNPQSSGRPTWFVLPDEMVRPTLDLLATKEAPEDDPDRKRLAAAIEAIERANRTRGPAAT